MLAARWHRLTRGEHPTLSPSSPHESLEAAWSHMALPVAVLIAPATFTLAFAKTAARHGTGAPTTGPQVHL